MSLAPGTRLGPYEIIARIGAGGMGEVWKARDTRLDRTVAIKKSLLPFQERFEREAHAAAALNHPNICTLHDVGPDYLVMEYIEGKPLKGPLEVEEAVRLGVEIASALEAAHGAGIVHRDLKPANILRTKSGVKLLDFGLAKLNHEPHALAAESVTRAMTQEGTIIGTMQYMAPEQMQGKEADARSDIFAFGAVLYELITGRPAFTGGDAASLIAAVMTKEPASLAAEKLAPEALDRVVRKCLAKDPDRRWQTARDLRDELEWIAQGGGRAVAELAPQRRWRAAGWWVAAAASVALVALALWPRQKLEPPPVVRFTVPYPGPMSQGSSVVPHVSPNGELIGAVQYFPNLGEYALHRLSTGDSGVVRKRDGSWSGTWSPDSKEMLTLQDRKLVRVDALDNTQQAIEIEAVSSISAWGPEGIIAVPPGGGFVFARTNGSGRIVVVPRLPDTLQWAPQFLPDGKHFLFTRTKQGQEGAMVCRGDISGGPVEVLFRAGSQARYAEPGYLLFVQSGNLHAVRFDKRENRPVGDPVVLVRGVAAPSGANLVGLFSVSQTGVLAYTPADVSFDSKAVWLERSGRKVGEVGAPANYSNLALSPDEKRLALDIRDPKTGKRDLWMIDLARTTRSRFTFEAGEDFCAVFSADGSRLLFTSDRTGRRNMYMKSSQGTGEEEKVADFVSNSTLGWSPDGRYVLYDIMTNVQNKLMLLDLTAQPREGVPLLGSKFREIHGRFSPDGKWVTYVSDESGRNEVYVQSFPPGKGKWQISNEGGGEPQWRGDGGELFYVNGDQMMAVPIRAAGATLEPGLPKRLFEVRLPSTVLRNRWVVTKDGQKFLALLAIEEKKPSHFNVVVNWPSLLERK